jgi:metallo-beta-lactamase family protein
MKIQLFGAAGEVTGSAYYVQCEAGRLLVDFGLFQGSKESEAQNKLPEQLPVKDLDAVVLTHAHLDHTGRLPLLTKAGYRGPIFATQATRELAALIVNDSAHLQEGEAERHNRKHPQQPKVEPLYTQEEAERILPRFQTVELGRPFEPVKGVTVTLKEAGHMLGSTSIQLATTTGGKKRTVVFSGDLGPRGAPLLNDPEPFHEADVVFLESTYGDRDHRPLSQTLAECRTILQRAAARGGKMLIPVFAIGRAQDMMYHIAGMFRRGEVPVFPIYLDSPMAIEALNIFKHHPELFDAEAKELWNSGVLTNELEALNVCRTAEDSRKLNDLKGPMMILAASGMCTGGRIMHHLLHNLSKPETEVLIVGYQGEGTLGRKLVDGVKKVSVLGEPVEVRAQVSTMGGFSAHAGQTELLDWLACMAKSKPRVILTHGEDKGRQPLAAKIQQRYGLTSTLPKYADVIEV